MFLCFVDFADFCLKLFKYFLAEFFFQPFEEARSPVLPEFFEKWLVYSHTKRCVYIYIYCITLLMCSYQRQFAANIWRL